MLEPPPEIKRYPTEDLVRMYKDLEITFEAIEVTRVMMYWIIQELNRKQAEK